MPCYCGATDCPSCGPAQGYQVTRIYDPISRGYIWVNPEDELPEDEKEDEGWIVNGLVRDVIIFLHNGKIAIPQRIANQY